MILSQNRFSVLNRFNMPKQDERTESANRKRLAPVFIEVCVIAIIAGWTFRDARAGEPDPESTPDIYTRPLSEILDTEILVVGKYKESLERTPARVTVYTKEDLRRLKPRNLADLLELTSGFLVGRDTDDISLGGRGVVTDNNQKFMVAIDGHRISNNNNFGVNPFHETRNLIEIAERIEIVRGSGGELWGPDAFLGLINIVTRKADSKQKSTDASLTYGLDETTAGSLTYLEKLNEDVKVSFHVDTIRSDGEKVRTDLAGKGGADVRDGGTYEQFESPTFSLNARADVGTGWISGQIVNVVSGVENAPQEEEFGQQYFEAGKKFVVDRTTALSARFYGDRHTHERRASGADGELFSESPETRLGAEFVASTTWSDSFRTVAGWDTRFYRYSGGSVGTLFPETVDDNMGTVEPAQPFPVNAVAVGDYKWNGFFAEGVYNAGLWDLHAGGRVDIFSDQVDDLFSPRAAVGLYPTKDLSFKLIFSRGALRPSWTQLSGFFSFNGQGNPDLESEESTNYELLMDWASDVFFTSLSIYHSQYDDTISYVHTERGFGFENYADYRTTGIEWDNKVKLVSFLDAFFNFTWYVDVERDEDVSLLKGDSPFGTEGQQVRPGTDDPFGIPEYFFTTGTTLYIPVANRDLSVTPIVRYIGPRFIQPGDDLPIEKEDSVYVDLKAGIDLAENFDLSLIAKNIFDNQDAVGIARGIPGLVRPKGSTYELRATYRF